MFGVPRRILSAVVTVILLITLTLTFTVPLVYVRSLESKFKILEAQLGRRDELEGIGLFTEAEPRCQPVQQVAFAKTHKTGSSTLQNVLFRYGVKHDLNFALPPNGWMFSFKEMFQANMVLNGPFRGLEYSLFAFHSVWNYSEIGKVIPAAKHITILRDPTECFESNYVYMGLERIYKQDFNQFATHKSQLNSPRRPKSVIDKNQQLWDLGLSGQDMENRTLVEAKIKALDQQLDLVLIVERFDESLILLGDLLCWPLEDLAYLKQNERIAQKKTNITEESRQHMRKWLWADYLLYDHFKAKMERQRRLYGRQRLRQNLMDLKAAVDKVARACVVLQGDNSKLSGEFKMALPIVMGYVMDETKPWCAPYARSEPNFAKQIHDHQLLKLSAKKLMGKF